MNSYLQNVSDISTHSLTRRLTDENSLVESITRYFNSQPHKEADRYCFAIAIIIRISTHSLTRRLTAIVAALVLLYTFQLTASQGG